MQGADGLAGGQSPVSHGRASAGLVSQNSHHGIERRVHGIDARKVGIYHLRGTQLSTCDALRQFSG
jgi:hypothetical protein